MRKAITSLEIVYEQIEVSPEESQQKLNEMFDILFEETLKYLNEKKEQKRIIMNEVKNNNDQIKKGENHGKLMFN